RIFRAIAWNALAARLRRGPRRRDRRRRPNTTRAANRRCVSDFTGASSPCVRCRGGCAIAAYAFRSHAWRPINVERATRFRPCAVSLLVGPLRARREQTHRLKRRRQLVPAARQCAGGNCSSHAATRERLENAPVTEKARRNRFFVYTTE